MSVSQLPNVGRVAKPVIQRTTTIKAKAIEAPTESRESFAALAAAVHPAWHQAIIRLANATRSVSSKMDLFLESTGKKNMRSQARELVESLINYLDMVEGEPDIEQLRIGIVAIRTSRRLATLREWLLNLRG